MLATLPTGFAETPMAAGLSNATAMEFAPNGDLWVLEQAGTVKRFRPGSTTADVVGNLSTLGMSASGERGLLGIAFDPQYASNKQVFLYYTATSPNTHNRISRFTVNDTDATDYFFAGTSTTPVDAGSSGTPTQTIIFELDALSSATNHNGGAIHFGPDGKLYAAVGDNANSANAQTLGNLHGKVLRINNDGSIPADNPFFGVTTAEEQSIWALGLRNPFTFIFQPGTGRMFINDVGQGSWEEINDGIAGSNYGWPGTEGNQGTPPSGPGVYRAPVYTYSHGGGPFQGFAITGGTFYNSPTQQFPAEYAGDYFFADYVNDWINVLDVSTNAVRQFATGALGAVDLRVASDGSLYYLARGVNQVFRVSYTASPDIVRIIDNGDAGFSTTGAWIPYANTGYQSDVMYTAAGTGTDVAAWTFAGLTAGQYRVSVTWSAHSNRATNAPFTILDGASPLATVRLNQESAPNDFSNSGAAWEDLGTFAISGSTLVVRLTNDANEYVIADAVRIERVTAPPPPPTIQIIDNADARFSTTGAWTFYPNLGYQNSLAYSAAGAGSNVAVWAFDNLAAGQYRVSVTWTAHANRATNAPFTVLDGASPFATVRLNQEFAPNDFNSGGAAWEDLGTFAISGSTLAVRLTNDANEYVIADAVRFERVTAPPPPPTSQIIDNGDAGFTTTGAWIPYANTGYQNDVAYTAAGAGAAFATWTFTNLTAGQYRVSVTWSAHSNRATNAPFTVLAGTTALTTVRLNQELAPNDFAASGVPWETLGTFTINGPTLSVRLTNDANEYVIVDAVMIERLS